MPGLTIVFFQTARRSSPVIDWLNGLDDDNADRVLADLALLENYGFAAAVTTRHIEGDLWEIKSLQQRVFYAVVIAGTIVLLHAYKKQGPKAPPNEIRVAKKRLKTYLEGQE